MSGETESAPSAWTIDSLHEHFLMLVAGNDRRYTERFDAQEVAMSTALVAAEKAVSAALVSAKEAVLKAENESIKWQAGANEWRGAMNDREATFVPRPEYDQRFSLMAEVQHETTARFDESLRRLHSRVDTMTGTKAGGVEARNNLYAMLAALAASVGIVSTLLVLLSK